MPRSPRHPRCARCIKQRKQCDAGQPRCGLCTSTKRMDCVYPAGTPSRREFLEMEARGEAEQNSARDWGEMDVDVDADHPATVENQRKINHDSRQEASSYDQTSPGLLHARPRGGDSQRLASACPSLHALTPNPFSMSASTIPVTAQLDHGFTEDIDSSHVERTDVQQQNLSHLSHNASSFSTKNGDQSSNSYTSSYQPRKSAKLDDAFSPDTRPEINAPDDPHSIHTHYPAALLQALDAESEPPPITPEQIGTNLADALEANAPRHVGGLLHGLSDWTGYVDEVDKISAEDLKAMDVEEEMERIKFVLLSGLEKRGG